MNIWFSLLIFFIYSLGFKHRGTLRSSHLVLCLYDKPLNSFPLHDFEPNCLYLIITRAVFGCLLSKKASDSWVHGQSAIFFWNFFLLAIDILFLNNMCFCLAMNLLVCLQKKSFYASHWLIKVSTFPIFSVYKSTYGLQLNFK